MRLDDEREGWAMTGADVAGLRRQVLRRVSHWEGAAERLDDFEATASPASWAGLERYVGVTLRKELKDAREQLKREAALLRAQFAASRSRGDLERVAENVARLRDRYLQTELLVDFYVDAVRARSNPELSAQLRACDVMAERAITSALKPLGKPCPPILTYFKPGIGASILRMGTQLWDGSLSQIAAVKLTYHNRLRPTALIHEAGHQFAAILGWNEALAQALRDGLGSIDRRAALQVAAWSSEIAADVFAFVHTGFASVAALTDVISGRGGQVFRYLPGDPHPVSFLRVLLGVEMCRRFYGQGAWDELAATWLELYPMSGADQFVADLIRALLPALPRVVELGLLTPVACFSGRRLSDLVDPKQVAPFALREMERQAAGSVYTSSHWIWTECLRLTALSGLRYAEEPERGREILQQQEEWMVRLGELTMEAT